MANGWGSYSKVSYCFFGRYAQKTLAFRGNFTKAVDKHPDYGVNFVQFRYCLDWKTCPLYGIRGFLHFRGFDCTQTYVTTFSGTKQSVHNIVYVCFSGVSVRWGSTVHTVIAPTYERVSTYKRVPTPPNSLTILHRIKLYLNECPPNLLLACVTRIAQI